MEISRGQRELIRVARSNIRWVLENALEDPTLSKPQLEIAIMDLSVVLEQLWEAERPNVQA